MPCRAASRAAAEAAAAAEAEAEARAPAEAPAEAPPAERAPPPPPPPRPASSSTALPPSRRARAGVQPWCFFRNVKERGARIQKQLFSVRSVDRSSIQLNSAFANRAR